MHLNYQLKIKVAYKMTSLVLFFCSFFFFLLKIVVPDMSLLEQKLWNLCSTVGFPGSAYGKEPACQCKRCKRWGFDPCIRKISWGRVQQPTPVFLPGESHGQRCLVEYAPWGRKEWDMTVT